MRKISILSLIAVLAATPMMAEAIEAAGKVNIDTPAANTAPNNGIATTSYVKGAYNAAIDEINTNRAAINTLNGDATTAGSVAKAEADAKAYADSGVATLTNKTINLDSGNTISNIEVEDFKSTAIATSINSNVDQASNSAFATEKAVRAAINAVDDAANSLAGRVSDLESNTSIDSAVVNSHSLLTSTTDLASNVVNIASEVEKLGGDASTEGSVAHTIAGLDATVSYASSGINIQVTEADGKLTGVTANIIDAAVTTAKIDDAAVVDSKIATSAVTTDKINAGAVTFAKMNASAVVTNEEGGISSTVEGASDSALVTEKAVAAAISAINGDASALESRVSDNETAIGVLNGGSETEGSVAKAEADAKAWADQKLVTVYTTWNTSNSATVSLTNTPTEP